METEKVEKITFELTEAATKLYDLGEHVEALRLLQAIDRLCDTNSLDMPDDAVSLNVELDEKLNTDSLGHNSHLAFLYGLLVRLMANGYQYAELVAEAMKVGFNERQVVNAIGTITNKAGRWHS